MNEPSISRTAYLSLEIKFHSKKKDKIVMNLTSTVEEIQGATASITSITFITSSTTSSVLTYLWEDFRKKQ